MKIKLLKEVVILSHRFNITYDKTRSGGTFDFSDSSIAIGTSGIKENPDYVFAVICHEISEIIHVILNHRYDEYGTMRDFKFIMSHKEFQNHNFVLAEIITKFIDQK